MTHQTAAARFLMLLLLTCAANAQTPADPLAPFGWFKDMAGHCWSGAYPDGKTSDTQCYSVQFGRILRGTIELSGVHGSQPVANFQGDSVYAWNPKTNRAQYTFWASDGTYGAGEMYREGDQLVFPPTGNADSPSAMRSVWRRVDANSFIVSRERRQGNTWSKVFEVTYRRREAQHPNAGANTSEVNRVADEYVSGVTILGVEDGAIKTWSDYFDFRSFAEQMRLPVCKAPPGGG